MITVCKRVARDKKNPLSQKSMIQRVESLLFNLPVIKTENIKPWLLFSSKMNLKLAVIF